MSSSQQAPSFGSMFLKYGGGVALMFGALALFSMVSGMKFAFGGSGGVPLTASAPGVAMLLTVGVACWALGSRWDTPGFVDFRKRRRWFVPVVSTFVVFPLFVIALFAMLQ